jgi:hypothetical protein
MTTVRMAFDFDAPSATAASRSESGNRPEKLFGAADRDRNHHHAQGDAARERGKVMLPDDDHGVRENANDDRRHAVQQVGRVAHDETKTCCPRTRPDRRRPENRWARRSALASSSSFRAAHDCVRHPSAGFAHRHRQLREEIPVQTRSAVPEQVPEDEEQDTETASRVHTPVRVSMNEHWSLYGRTRRAVIRSSPSWLCSESAGAPGR